MDTKDEQRADRKHVSVIRAGKLDLDDLEEKAADDYAINAMLHGDDDWLESTSDDDLRALVRKIHTLLRAASMTKNDALQGVARQVAFVEALEEIDDVIYKCAAEHARRLRENGDL